MIRLQILLKLSANVASCWNPRLKLSGVSAGLANRPTTAHELNMGTFKAGDGVLFVPAGGYRAGGAEAGDTAEGWSKTG